MLLVQETGAVRLNKLGDKHGLLGQKEDQKKNIPFSHVRIFSCFAAFVISFMFSPVCHRFHFFPRFSPVAILALSTSYIVVSFKTSDWFIAPFATNTKQSLY